MADNPYLAMNYLILIQECIQHSKLPEWALAIIAEVKMYYDKYPVTDRKSILHTIDSMIDSITFSVRNSRSTGDVIPTRIEGEEMTVYSLTGSTPYLKISFKPTRREKIIDPFSI